jgi:hypothetical protein
MEATQNILETDNLKTKLQEQNKINENLKRKLEESHGALEELKQVSQLNEELWMRDLNILREKICELQKNKTERIPQIKLNKTKNEAKDFIEKETGSVLKTYQNSYKEDERNVEGKAKIALVLEKPDKVIEDDLKEYINQDEELLMNTSGNTVKSVTKEGKQMNIIKFMKEVGNPAEILEHSIHEPIHMQQVIKLQDVEDWTYWKVRPPPKRKK